MTSPHLIARTAALHRADQLDPLTAFVDETEAETAEFYEEHERWMGGYYEARMPQPGAVLGEQRPEEWEGDLHVIPTAR